MWTLSTYLFIYKHPSVKYSIEFRLRMEIYIIVSIICGVIVVLYTWRIINWAWLKPKKLEKIMRAQGFNGNSYKLLHGDLKEMTKAIEEANSKPLNLSDDILPRSVPHTYQLVQKYGTKTFQWLGPRLQVFIMDPQLIKEVLSKNYQYLKPESHSMGKYLFTGILQYEGDKWAKQRKLLNPAFHMEKLKLMMPAFYLSCMNTLNKWENLVASSKGGCELDVWPHLQTLTADAISRTAFGSNYEEGRKVFELLREQTQLVIKAVRSLDIPGMRFLPTKMNRRIKEIANEIDVSITNVINRRIAMKAGETRFDDLLGILLEPNLKENEDKMSIHEIIQECKLFYFAGQETTSILLVWTMVLLGKHPEWQERAREEVLQKFGFEKPGLEDLNQLKIVTMILYEVLRLYTPVPALGRRTAEEMKLGNLTLPAGVHIHLPFMLLHHDVELWGADAKEFKPERFGEGVLKATKGNASFFAFSGGPRICIGQNFAFLEAKMALATILQRFSFELSPSYAHAPYNIGTLQPQHGAHFILHTV
ncbi:hypothetical protein Leryth_022161 [Lithospermum erythrorhizon]|nr:hypothetical protein Leryth_022161 [Lithospermum erythrorhizon]